MPKERQNEMNKDNDRTCESSKNPEGRFDLGVCYLKGLGVGQDLEAASKWFEKAAEAEPDAKDRLMWYKKAAELGDAHSQFKVAEALNSGAGGERCESSEAFNRYKVSAEGGDVNAMCELGNYYLMGLGCQQDRALGLQWCVKAAEKGFGLAQRMLGNIYSNERNAEYDINEARKWYQKAADQGDDIAKDELRRLS